MEQYPRLKELYQELVLTQKKLTYEDFWQRYEYRCDMSRVIHGILQGDDADLSNTVMDDSETVKNTTISRCSLQGSFEKFPTNAVSTNQTTSNRANIHRSPQLTEGLILKTMKAQMNNNNDDIVEDMEEEGISASEPVDSTKVVEASPSPSAGDERDKAKDKVNDRPDSGLSVTLVDPMAGEVVEEFNWNELPVKNGGSAHMSQDWLNDNLVSSFDMMVNGSRKFHVDVNVRDATSNTIDGAMKKPNVSVVFLMKCALTFSILVASIICFVATVVLRDGVVPFDTLCSPIRPGLDVTLLDMDNATRFSAPWWAPEELKEISFSVLCSKGGYVRTEIEVEWNVKKRCMGISIVDLNKGQSLLTLKQLRSFQVLPKTLQLRAETTRGRVTFHPAPWSTTSSHDLR